jgi:hypothetical protein
MIGKSRANLLIIQSLQTIIDSIKGNTMSSAEAALSGTEYRTVFFRTLSENLETGRRDHMLVFVAVTDSEAVMSGVADRLAPLV